MNTQGTSGVCVEFERKKLLSAIPTQNFRHGNVVYKSPKEFTSTYSTSYELPFIKGDAYRHEMEYRVIYAEKEEKLAFKHIPIKVNLIRTIKLSPWMPKPLVESAIKVLKSIDGCYGLVVKDSKIIENEAWIQYVNRNNRREV